MKKVEDFRLTKDQLDWMKEVKKINRIETMLREGALQQWLQQGEVLKKVFDGLGERKRMLGVNVPGEQMDEIPQQTLEDRRKREEILGGEQLLGQGEGEEGTLPH